MASPPDPRTIDWSRRLGPLRLDAEPLRVQLERRRKVSLGVTGVSLIVSALFLQIFFAFSAPLLGLAVVSALLGPVIAGAWLEYRGLKRRVAEYEQNSSDRL